MQAASALPPADGKPAFLRQISQRVHQQGGRDAGNGADNDAGEAFNQMYRMASPFDAAGGQVGSPDAAHQQPDNGNPYRQNTAAYPALPTSSPAKVGMMGNGGPALGVPTNAWGPTGY